MNLQLKTMKNHKNFLFRISVAALPLLFSCSECDMDEIPSAQTARPRTYRLALVADIQDYDTPTRSTLSWSDGDRLYLQFHHGANVIAGTATYAAATASWSVTANQTLPDDATDVCEAYFFRDATGAGSASASVSLAVTSAPFADTSASYYVVGEETVYLYASLFPLSGRVRFRGAAGTSCGVTGLSRYLSYSVAGNSFTSGEEKITSTVAADGYTPYFYARFTDEAARTLCVDLSATAQYRRSFGNDVLATGQSGYITLPTAASHAGWTLINSGNQQEITLPVLSDVTVSSIRSKVASLAATVTDAGNGTLAEAGFYYSTSASPTTDGTKVSCGTSTAVSGHLSSLTPETTYYVAAYATNERGTAYSTVASFRTISEAEDGSTFSREEYGEDENWNF